MTIIHNDAHKKHASVQRGLENNETIAPAKKAPHASDQPLLLIAATTTLASSSLVLSPHGRHMFITLPKHLIHIALQNDLVALVEVLGVESKH